MIETGEACRGAILVSGVASCAIDAASANSGDEHSFVHVLLICSAPGGLSPHQEPVEPRLEIRTPELESVLYFLRNLEVQDMPRHVQRGVKRVRFTDFGLKLASLAAAYQSEACGECIHHQQLRRWQPLFDAALIKQTMLWRQTGICTFKQHINRQKEGTALEIGGIIISMFTTRNAECLGSRQEASQEQEKGVLRYAVCYGAHNFPPLLPFILLHSSAGGSASKAAESCMVSQLCL